MAGTTSNSTVHAEPVRAGGLLGISLPPEFTHQLPTKQEIAHVHYGFRIGQNVKFDFEGKILTGILHKVHKRAIVMVLQKNGTFLDTEGKRYGKYYVPLTMLHAV